jgi:hypothetical protein
MPAEQVESMSNNPLTRDRLIVAPAKRPLSLYAALLYRMALAGFLDLKHVREDPKPDDITEYIAFRHDQFEFGKYQRDIEIALGTIMRTEEEYRRERQQRVEEARRRSRHVV